MDEKHFPSTDHESPMLSLDCLYVQTKKTEIPTVFPKPFIILYFFYSVHSSSFPFEGKQA